MRFLSQIIPQFCELCQGRAHEQPLCQDCLADLPRIQNPCLGCANPMPQANLVCGQCIQKPPLFDGAVAVCLYQNPVDWLVKQLKFHGKLHLSVLMGHLLSEQLRQSNRSLPDGILPVPLHRRRLISRGYNQAYEIADVVSQHLKIPMFAGYVRRARHTEPQSNLAEAERHQNLKGAFIHKGAELPRHVAIIDDVITTGATAKALTQVLKAAGVHRVEIWTFTRAK